MKKTGSLRTKLSKVITKLDPNVTEGEPTYNAYLVLLGAANVGPNADKISKAVGIPRETTRILCRRARENGIFKGGMIHADWLDEKDGGLSFVMDATVVMGLMKRCEEEENAP